jgi:bifunctional DNA-binding transcriptional regulator/antitoxin component of YhaV-PrlF toxin-antitoxin module
MHSADYRTRRLMRSGFSVGFTIPVAFCRALGLKKGDEVKVYIVGDVLCLKKVDSGIFTPGVVAVRSADYADHAEED